LNWNWKVGDQVGVGVGVGVGGGVDLRAIAGGGEFALFFFLLRRVRVRERGEVVYREADSIPGAFLFTPHT
jgi:hypothetical protein